MKNMWKWILGAAVVVAGLGLGTTTAQAAEFRVRVGVPVAYVPACPGPGYVWADGYYANGVWVGGRWNFVGGRGYYGRGFDRHVVRYRGYDRFRR